MLALAPQLEFPEGLACAGGHVYVASVGEPERRCVVAKLALPQPLAGVPPSPRVLAHRVMPGAHARLLAAHFGFATHV